MSQLVWLITGCSSGFGEQFVHSILARGDKVIATGSRLGKLKHLEEVGVAILQLDITDSQPSILDTIANAISIYGKIVVLINNASYIQIGTWEDLEYQDFLAQFDSNVFGTIKVTRALLPHFRQRRTGTMVFIGSLSGWIGHAGCSAYAGSKFALEGIVEGLSRETAHLGIKTLLIKPGRFRTKLLSSSNKKIAVSNPRLHRLFHKSGGFASERGPGSARRSCEAREIILDLVCQEGVAEGREIPFRLPLGVDVYDDMKAKSEETLRLLEEWKSVIRSTDHEDKMV